MRLITRSKNTYMIVGKARLWQLLLAIVMLCNPVFSALSAPPETDKIEVYIPVESERLTDNISALQNTLNKANLAHFKLVPVKYWSTYQRKVLNGNSGVYLAAPHFSAWLIEKHNFKLLARLVEPLKYVIATRRFDSTLFEISDLGGQEICAQAPLNLDYLTAQQALQNSLIPTNVATVRSVRQEMLKPGSSCKGFAISDHIFQAFLARDPDLYIRLYQSRTYPNYAFVADQKTTQLHGNKLIKWLLDERTKGALTPILRQFSSRAILSKGGQGDYSKTLIEELNAYWGR